MASPSAEFWTVGAGIPGRTARLAARAESDGWDGLALVDSQNLGPDTYVHLTLAATATTRLRLATGVTNPLTRHPAVTASAIATVQAESGGRAVLGVGRGDSSLAYIGLAPANPSAFEHYLERLQGYLRGDDVPFDVEADGHGAAPPAERLGMADAPTASQIRWISAAGPKVPLDVAATGPRVIAIAARHADRITFAVGADPTRMKWAIDRARTAAAEAGRDPETIALGAYVPTVVNVDRAKARALAAGGVASFARFSVMYGTMTGPDGAAGSEGRTALGRIHDTYDMNRHFTYDSPQSRELPDEVIDAYGVAGPPAYCTERLGELIELGLTKLVLLGGAINADREGERQSRSLLASEVLPALR